MTEIVVGAPVHSRAWVLPRWFDHVEAACQRADLDPGYVFVVDPADEATNQVISERAGRVQLVRIPQVGTSDREWGAKRYTYMVGLRNLLLTGVRTLGPALFLSLDSDILLHPEALVNMIETLVVAPDGRHFDAVGAKCYMTPGGTVCPSYALVMGSGGLRRPDHTGVIEVDAIMAAKLMSPAAYKIDYRVHHHGEDIGWSLACREAGLRLGWDGRVTSKHVMDKSLLEPVDVRCGY